MRDLEYNKGAGACYSTVRPQFIMIVHGELNTIDFTCGCKIILCANQPIYFTFHMGACGLPTSGIK